MKSPGKQIPGFERKKKKERLLEEQRKGKRIPLSIIFLFFLFTTLSTQNKVHIQREEYNGRDMSDGFSFQIFNMATFERQEEVCTNIEWGLSRWGRLDDKKDRMYSHERSELLIGLCIISLFI